MKFQDFIKIINKELEVVKQNIGRIILVANVRNKKPLNNNFIFNEADVSEQFSEEEYNQIIKGIKLSGFNLHLIYYNEIDLIKDIINEKIKTNNTLVYNLIRNGHIYSRKCLMPAFLEFINFPYTCSNSLTVSLCRNKYYVMKLLQSHNIRVPETYIYKKNNNTLPNIKFPFIIKDIMGAASTGMSSDSIVFNNKEFNKKISLARAKMNETLVLQQFIEGMECEVPVFIYKDDIIVMEPVGIAIEGKKRANNNILTYECSYNDDYDFFPLENEISKETLNEIKQLALKTTKLLKIKNYGRIDFRISPEGTPYIIDISTTPYTTIHSSFVFAFKNNGLPYEKIYQSIIVNSYLSHEYDK